MNVLLVEKLFMMSRKRLPKSIRKYIRQEKARLRREILDLTEQRKQIEEIYIKLGIKREKASPAETTEGETIAKKKIK